MEPDNYQQAWQAESSQTRVTIDADLLRQEVQRDRRNFRSMIIWGDVGEVWIYILLLPLWFYLGITLSSPWTWYLAVPALVWGAGFLLVYRMRHKRNAVQPEEPLRQCVERSLTETEDQLWLQRNGFWRSSLPLGIALLVYLAHDTWLRSENWLDVLGHAVVFVCVFAVFGFVYFLNRYTIHSKYEPRRRELLTLLASLRDETADAGGDERVHLPGLPFADERARTPPCSPARMAIGMFAFMAIMLCLVFVVMIMVNTDPYHLTGEGYPKRSPFAGVRWQADQPEVKVGDEWFKLVSLEEIPTEEIVAFSKRTYGDKWRKRFEEDLVELLTRMGHPPGDKVTLVVRSLTSPETRTLEDVPMTYANRRAIRETAQKRETSEP